MRTIRVCLCVLTFGVLALRGTASPQNRAPVESPKLTKPATVAVSKSGTIPSAASESALATKLPVRRVVLYKSGVGYFEHVGDVRGDQTVRSILQVASSTTSSSRLRFSISAEAGSPA